MTSSENSLESSLAITHLKINYTNNVPGRGTSFMQRIEAKYLCI